MTTLETRLAEIEARGKLRNHCGLCTVDKPCNFQNCPNEDIPFLLQALNRYKDALERIADPRKRAHKEPDAYTTLGCVMNMAEQALAEVERIMGEE